MIDQYLIGYTVLSASEKGDKYRTRVGFQHVIILADKMKQADALDFEHRIQKHIMSDKLGRLCSLYHKEKIALDRTIRSSGGSTRGELDPICSVYMAWWDKS